MRALVVAIAIFVAAGALAAEHQFVSPTAEFEAYTTAANDSASDTDALQFS